MYYLTVSTNTSSHHYTPNVQKHTKEKKENEQILICKLANKLTLAGVPTWTLLPLNLSCSPLIKSVGAIFIGVVVDPHLSQYQHLIVISGFQPIEGSRAHTFIRKC